MAILDIGFGGTDALTSQLIQQKPFWLHLMWQSPQRDQKEALFQGHSNSTSHHGYIESRQCILLHLWHKFMIHILSLLWLCSSEFWSCQSAEPSGYIHLLDMSLVLFVSWFYRCHFYKHVTLQCSLELELDCCHNIDWIQTIPLDGLSAFVWIRFEVCLSVLHLWFTACLCYSVFQPQEKARLDLPVMLECTHFMQHETLQWHDFCNTHRCMLLKSLDTNFTETYTLSYTFYSSPWTTLHSPMSNPALTALAAVSPAAAMIPADERSAKRQKTLNSLIEVPSKMTLMDSHGLMVHGGGFELTEDESLGCQWFQVTDSTTW